MAADAQHLPLPPIPPATAQIAALETELDVLRRAAELAREVLDLAADPYSDFWRRGRRLSYQIAASAVIELDIALGATSRPRSL